jgi:hypothetical protein
MKKLSFPLFVQFVLLNELVARVHRAALPHFSSVAPRELGDFSWILDAKDKILTEHEVMWTRLSGSLLKPALLREPTFGIQGADSSEFDHEFLFHRQNWPAYLPKIEMEPGGTDSRIIDLRKVLSKSRTLADSKEIIGLQIADILTNACRRAVREGLQPAGGEGLGKLMLRAGSESVVGWMTLSGEKDGQLLPRARSGF